MFDQGKFKVVLVAMALIALLAAIGGLVISRWDQQLATCARLIP